MKTKRLIIAGILMLALLTLGIVCAEENQTAISNDNTPEDVQTPIETEKISNYTYEIKNMPQGNVSTFDYPVELVEMPQDARGNVSVSIDSVEKYNREVSPVHNQLFLDELKLPFGEHFLELKYSGDVKYEGFSQNSTFYYNYITFDVPDVVDADDCDKNHMTITYVDDIKGNLKVQIDGKTVYNSAIKRYEYEDFKTEIYLDDLTFNTHTYQITYSNGNYKSLTRKGSFNVTYPLEITFIDDIEFGDEVDFYIETIYADCYLNLTLNDRTYPVYCDWGSGKIRLSDFNLGENTVSVSYKDEYHPLKTTTKTFNVAAKLNTPEVMGYGENESISIEVPKETEGNLTVKINDITKSAKITDGKASIPLNNLTPGEYRITIENELTGQVNYTLTVQPNIIIADKMWIEDERELKFEAPESYSGTLEILNLGNYTVKNGKATVSLNSLKTGCHTLHIKYENYTWTFDIEISKQNPNWIMDISAPDYNNYHTQDYYVGISNAPRNPYATGTLTIYLDNVKFGDYDMNTFYDEDGGYLEGLNFNMTHGMHNLTFAYSGDDYYRPHNVTKTVECVDVLIYFIDYEYDTVYIIVPRDDEGQITIYLDKELYRTIIISKDDYLNDEDYEGNIVKSYGIDIEDYQTHEVEVRYSGKYGNITKSANVTVPYELSFYTPDYYTYGDEESEITVMIPEDATKQVIVTINNESYATNSIPVGNFKPGTYNVTLTYPGDDKYPEKTTTSEFTVKGRIISGYIEDESGICYIGYGDSREISLTLPEDAVGNLTVYIGNGNDPSSKYATKALKNGKANITIPTSKVGKYYIKASYSGNYDVDDLEFKVVICPEITYPSTMTWSDDKYITIRTSNTTDARLIITHIFHEDFADVRFSGCETKISLKNLDIGQYDYSDLQAYFWADGEIVYSTSVDITVKPIKSKLIGGKNLNGYYTDTKTYSLKVYGDYGKLVGAGELVTIKVGSTTYKVKTDKNGVAKLKLTKTPGTYTIKATYKGVTVKNTLKVKKILTLKTAKVKKSAKKLILKATLKKGKKAVKGKVIKFKFKGKTYKAKTNKYGIAKVTIKKSVLKKLKVGKKITYTATYLKQTVKKTAKVGR